MAPGFVPDPTSIPVTIAGGEIPELVFSMKPRGSLFGYIASTGERLGDAGKHVNMNEHVQIQPISLTGEGLYRTLTPQDEEIIYPEYYLSGRDFEANGDFQFFDLPTGEY